jgi:Zn-finger nucleic acid-binding protein
VATLRCARCFHLSLPSARHCEACGCELGLEPIPEKTALSCPDCRLLLVPRRPSTRTTAVTTVRYVPCPACSQLMGRKNFGGHSGVIVDVCREHGVWFDESELPRVLEFVERGGLAELNRQVGPRARGAV